MHDLLHVFGFTPITRPGRLPRFRFVLAAVLVMLLLGGCDRGQVPIVPSGRGESLEAPSTDVPTVGELLPYTRFIGRDGEIVDLAASPDGKKSLLVFMRGFSGFVCPYCTAQTAELVRRLEEIHGTNTELHVVFPGPAETIPKFLEAVRAYMKNDTVATPSLSVLMDVDLKAVDALGIRQDLARPCTFVLDPDGKLVYKYVGASPSDRPSLDDVLRVLEARPG